MFLSHLKISTGTKEKNLFHSSAEPRAGQSISADIFRCKTGRDSGDSQKLASRPNQRLREQKTDYLFYRLLDSQIDEYFIVLEGIGERIDLTESHILANPQDSMLAWSIAWNDKCYYCARSSGPCVKSWIICRNWTKKFISNFTRIYLRDLYDHTMQTIDTVETYRDITSSMMDIYLSSLTNRLNEVMKTLTIISTIFIPMTFIAASMAWILSTCRNLTGIMDSILRRVWWLWLPWSCWAISNGRMVLKQIIGYIDRLLEGRLKSLSICWSMHLLNNRLISSGKCLYFQVGFRVLTVADFQYTDGTQTKQTGNVFKFSFCTSKMKQCISLTVNKIHISAMRNQ